MGLMGWLRQDIIWLEFLSAHGEKGNYSLTTETRDLKRTASRQTLTGESRFHLSTPRELNWVPHNRKQAGGPLDKWNSEIAGSPQRPTMLVVKPEGGPGASVKPGQKSCVRPSGIITLFSQNPSDGLGWIPSQMRPQRFNHIRVTNVMRQR
jgi:hypothetical protein